MIAVVKRWHAVFPALLFSLPLVAAAADDVSGAARELARRTAAFAGKGTAVAITWRNLSSLESLAAQARAAFDAALQDSGLRVSDPAPTTELHLTISENATQFLLVEEASKGDDRQVWIASWKRGESGGGPSPGVSLEKKLMWEQDEQILDIAFPPAGMLVLSPVSVALYTRNGTQWELRGTVPMTAAKPVPRDLRGRLRVKGSAFQLLLPGTLCEGTSEPALALDCHPSEEPWLLESGSRTLLLANFAGARNYFDGHVTTQTGQRKTVVPFFSAASAESQGHTWWLLAALDGKTQILDAALDPVGTSTVNWGSDIAGTDAHCGTGSQVLATQPVDRGQPDAVQAFTMADRTPQRLTDPVDFAGPVLALWSTGASATAVVHDLRTGKYGAYMLTVICGN